MVDQYETYFTPEMVVCLHERRDEFKDKDVFGTALDFGIGMLMSAMKKGASDLRLYLTLDALVMVCEILQKIPQHFHVPVATAVRELDFVKQKAIEERLEMAEPLTAANGH